MGWRATRTAPDQRDRGCPHESRTAHRQSAHPRGSSTLPRNSGVPCSTSWMTNRNGRSATSSVNTGARVAHHHHRRRRRRLGALLVDGDEDLVLDRRRSSAARRWSSPEKSACGVNGTSTPSAWSGSTSEECDAEGPARQGHHDVVGRERVEVPAAPPLDQVGLDVGVPALRRGPRPSSRPRRRRTAGARRSSRRPSAEASPDGSPPVISGTSTVLSSSSVNGAVLGEVLLERLLPRRLEVERVDQHQPHVGADRALGQDLGDLVAGLLGGPRVDGAARPLGVARPVDDVHARAVRRREGLQERLAPRSPRAARTARWRRRARAWSWCPRPSHLAGQRLDVGGQRVEAAVDRLDAGAAEDELELVEGRAPRRRWRSGRAPTATEYGDTARLPLCLAPRLPKIAPPVACIAATTPPIASGSPAARGTSAATRSRPSTSRAAGSRPGSRSAAHAVSALPPARARVGQGDQLEQVASVHVRGRPGPPIGSVPAPAGRGARSPGDEPRDHRSSRTTTPTPVEEVARDRHETPAARPRLGGRSRRRDLPVGWSRDAR